jgi:hypothetical protein
MFENIKIHNEFRRASLVVRLIFTHVLVLTEWLLKSLRPSVFSSAHMLTFKATDQRFMKFGIGEFWPRPPSHFSCGRSLKGITYTRCTKSCTTAHSSSERRRRRRLNKLCAQPSCHTKSKSKGTNLVCSVL